MISDPANPESGWSKVLSGEFDGAISCGRTHNRWHRTHVRVHLTAANANCICIMTGKQALGEAATGALAKEEFWYSLAQFWYSKSQRPASLAANY